MDLVDKQYGVFVALQLLQQIAKALFKITPVFGARHNGRHIQRQHPPPAQCRSGPARGNALRQCFGQRRFAHAGLPHQTGVVFAAAAQNFLHARQLALAAQNGVQFAFLRHSGQIAAIFIAGAAARAGHGTRRPRQHQLPGKQAAFPGSLRQLQPKAPHPHPGGALIVL